MTVSVDVEPARAPLPSAHGVDGGDGVCADCLWCEENFERDCTVPTDPKCAWCGHCLGNHVDTTEAAE
jgi:hypothetical protein